MKKTNVKLDTRKLLGFRLGGSNQSTGAKVGQPKVGAKVGAKVGRKDDVIR